MKKTFTFLLACCILSMNSGCSIWSQESLMTYKEINVSEKSSIPTDFFPQKLKVVSIGDSLTEGIGDSTGSGGYLPYLEKRLEKEKEIKTVEFVNFGVKGNRSSQVLERLQNQEVKDAIHDTDMVILTMGGNDIMKVVKDHFLNLQVEAFKTEQVNYERNLRQVIETIRKLNPESMIVLIGLYNPFIQWFPNVKELDTVLSDWNSSSQMILSQYEETLFVEIADIFRDNEKNLLYKDYFHPNDEGYKLIAKRVFEQLDDRTLAVIANKKVTSKKEAY